MALGGIDPGERGCRRGYLPVQQRIGGEILAQRGDQSGEGSGIGGPPREAVASPRALTERSPVRAVRCAMCAGTLAVLSLVALSWRSYLRQ